jgi:hypothetical protein
MKLMIAAVLLMAGCVASAPARPTTVQTNASADALYKASDRSLAERGLTAEQGDRSTGLVMSSWEPTQMMGTKYRFRYRLLLGSGRVRVDSDCQWYSEDQFTGGGGWTPCEQQPQDRIAGAAQLAADVKVAAEAMTAPAAPAASYEKPTDLP